MPHVFSYESMGTTWKITIWDDLSDTSMALVRDEIVQRSHIFDQTYSRFISTSLVWELARQTGVVEVPADFVAMLRWYKKLYAASNKKLNPLIGFTLSDLGYDADYSLTPQAIIRKTPDLDTVVELVSDHEVRLSESVLFDLGALGKGYFVDSVFSFLKEKGVQRYLVDGSGDIRCAGMGTPIRVGLEDPRDPSKVLGVIQMEQGAMCSSGTNRRTWGQYHHIIDPESRTSPSDILATWVIGGSAVLADALATCLFFVEPERFGEYAFDYCILNKDFRMKRSPGFNAELY